MSAADDLAANRKAQRDLAQQYQALGKKFNQFAAPHRKACDEKLRREQFPPFVAIERAREKVTKAQAEVAAKLRDLEVEQRALLERFDAEHVSEAGKKVEVEVDLNLDEPSDSTQVTATDIPELEL